MTLSLMLKAVTVAAEWVILLASLRYFQFGARTLAPVVYSLARLCNCNAVEREQRRKALSNKIDIFQVTFLETVMVPTSSILVFVGICLVGGGLAIGSLGEVSVLVARHPDNWVLFERALGWLEAPLICTGMAFGLAALSRNRTISAIVSCVWGLAGIGIGVVTVIAWPSLPTYVFLPVS